MNKKNSTFPVNKMFVRRFASLLLFFPGFLWAEQSVFYTVSFENAVHHEANISVTFKGIESEVLELRMSRSSPGRYALHEFGKNIYAVKAYDHQGKLLNVDRPDAYQWNVKGHEGVVTVQYILFADRADGTYSGIDRTHAHLNMPATFMWARGFEHAKVNVLFKPFDRKWKVATQLVATNKPYHFTAPNFQYFMDSPTELSHFDLRKWRVKSNGKTYTIKLAVHHDGIKEDVDRLTTQTKAVVAEQIKVFGELPDFDYGQYIFIADFLEHVAGDGMEHRNSTIVTSSRSLDDLKFNQLGTLSHEFFHIWNVERLRPKNLDPFNYEKANVSSELWFAEGFTSYYGKLTVRRADQERVDQYLRRVSDILSGFVNAPGRQYFSAVGMSRLAPFSDAATSVDPTNFRNMFISYYLYGEAIALALDLTLRSQFEGVTLDTFMRQLWKDYGKNERYYSNEDLLNSLAKVTNQDFAETFFTRYIFGHELPDYKSLLANAGVSLQKKFKGCPSVGDASIRFEERRAIIASNTVIGSPFYKAGLDRGDQILRFDRRKIRSREDWMRVLNRYKPGDTAKVHYIQRGEQLVTDVTFGEDQSLTVKRYRLVDLEETKEMLEFRTLWLGEERNKESQIGYQSRNRQRSNYHCMMRS